MGSKLWIQVLWTFLLAALIWLAVPQAARADWSVVGDTAPAGQIIDNDVLARGTDLTIGGTINGDLLANGSTVTVNGPVSGSLVAVGRSVTVNGQVDGSVYVAGRTLKLAALESATWYTIEGFALTISYPGGTLLFYDKDGPRPRC